MMRGLLMALAALVLLPQVAEAQDDLRVETAQVQDLTSIRQIKHMQASWGHMAMAGNWQGMGELLLPNARVEMGDRSLLGRAQIVDDLRTVQGGGADGMAAGMMNLRLWITPVITLSADGQSATGRWHEVAMTAEVGQSADWEGGTWVVGYVQVADGWRIAHMRYYEQFAGPYATGWSHDAQTLERAPYHYTPDEAGSLLPHRAADVAMAAEDVDHTANLLLAQSLAQNTVNAYGYYLDRGLYDDAADLFAGDALIEMGGAGSWRGDEGARAFLARFGEAGLDHGELNDHLQLMPMANVADDGSLVLLRNVDLAMTGQHGGDGQWQASMQTFLLRPDAQGHWRIAMMHRSPIMRADYAAGWSAPLPAMLPAGDDGAASGATELGSVDFRESGFAAAPLDGDVIVPSREPDFQMVPLPNALARAEAFDGAENVSNAYGYYIDQFAWRDTAAVFSRDGWKELSYIGTFIGQDRVLGSLIQRYGEGGPRDEFQAIHQKTQPYVTVFEDGQRAQIRTRLWQFNSATTPGGSWIGGIYENQVVKEDGIWRIHGMDLDYVWLADYAGGWMGIDPSNNSRYGVSEEVIAEFGPDAPLRGQTFAPYPDIRPMGFHFANPVSGREPEERLHWSDGHRE